MTAEYDYYAPFVSASLIDPEDGQVYPLSSNISPEVLERAGGPPELRTLAFLTNVTVRLVPGVISEITASLSPPFELARAFLDSRLCEFNTIRLEVQFGYINSQGESVLTPAFTGRTVAPDIQYGDDISITIKAQGGASLIRRKGARQFENKTRREIIETIARGPDPDNPRDVVLELNEFQTLFQRVATLFDRDVALEVNELLFEERINFNQGTLTDWWAIRELARDARCDVVLVGNKIVLTPWNIAMAGVPRRTLVMRDHGGQVGPSTGKLPLLTYSTSQNFMYLPSGLTQLVAADVSAETGEEKKMVVDDAVAKTTRTSKGAAQPGASSEHPAPQADGAGQTRLSVDPNRSEGVRKLIAQKDKITNTSGIQADISTLLDPELQPLQVVAIKGLCDRLDRNYLIQELTHRAGVGGYETQMKVVSNVTYSLNYFNRARSRNAEGVQPAGAENTNEAAEAAVNAVSVAAARGAGET